MRVMYLSIDPDHGGTHLHGEDWKTFRTYEAPDMDLDIKLDWLEEQAPEHDWSFVRSVQAALWSRTAVASLQRLISTRIEGVAAGHLLRAFKAPDDVVHAIDRLEEELWQSGEGDSFCPICGEWAVAYQCDCYDCDEQDL